MQLRQAADGQTDMGIAAAYQLAAGGKRARLRGKLI